MSYSRQKQVALALIPKFTASIGMMSSIFLITELIRDHKKGEGNAIKRVLLGVTLYEIMDAFGWWLSSWTVPRSTDFAFATGTIGSCNFQGFLLQIAIGAPINNGLLTYFFYLVVQQNYSTEMIHNLEWKVHAFVAFFAIGSSILLLSLKQYNPTNQVCWINGSPPGCGNSSPTYNPDVPCERGDHAYWYGLFFFYIILWCVIILIIFLNCRMRSKLVLENSKDAQWVSTQAMLYSLAFFITWMPSTLWSIMHWTNGGGFGLDVLAAVCEPLQGFWNLLIFIRNRPASIDRLESIFRCQCYNALLDDDTNHDTTENGIEDIIINNDNNTINDSITGSTMTPCQDILSKSMENTKPMEITVHFPGKSQRNLVSDKSMIENTRLYA